MSQEVFQIVEELNLEELQTQIALQCAPLLKGIKISNLLIVQHQDAQSVFEIFQGTRISVELIYQSPQKQMFLLYQKEELEAYLNEKRTADAMKMFGYDQITFEAICTKLKERYAAHFEEKGEFPHEIGLILGYPVDDVLGFIEHRGKNYLYTGYWKVYGNVVEAVALFEAYNEAKEQIIRKLYRGIGIRRMIA